MRKVVFERYGPPEVLDVVERDEPRPKSDEVRVRIHATTVTTAEAKMRRGEPRWMRPLIGVTKPRERYQTLGTELAGVVDAVGHEVTRFREGDEVFGFAGWHMGAEATGVCGTSNLDLVRSLGADQVIDHRHEDVRDTGQRWDVVFDAVGASSFAQRRPVLTDRGVFVPAVISIPSVLQGLWTPITGGHRLVGGVSMDKREPLRYLAELLADDALRVVIDTTFPTDEIRDTHRLIDAGHKTGNVVIDVA